MKISITKVLIVVWFSLSATVRELTSKEEKVPASMGAGEEHFITFLDSSQGPAALTE